MRRSIYSVLMVSLLLSLLLTIQLNQNHTLVIAEGFESNITNDTLAQGNPAIYQNRLVWHENTLENTITNWEIFLYDLSIDSDDDGIPNYRDSDTPDPDPARIRITNNASKQLNPEIFGDTIVWEDDRNGNFDIYVYDLSEDSNDDGVPNYLEEQRPYPDPAMIRITDNPAHQVKPAVYSTKIVWEDLRYGNKDVFIYDLISGKEAMIAGMNETGDPRYKPKQIHPKIYGDKVVWEDNRHGNFEVFLYNLSVDSDDDGEPNYLDDDRAYPDPAEERITQTSESDLGPSIYGDFLVYTRSDNIYLYDISIKNEYKLTSSTPEQHVNGRVCSIYGTKVVWEYNVGSYDVYLYDLTMDSDGDDEPNYVDPDTPYPDPAQVRITNESEMLSMIPAVYANTIVWADSRNLSKPWDRDIYLYTATENHPPKITYHIPNYTSEIKEGGALVFNVTASDPDGTELNYSWFLDNVLLPEEEDDTYEFYSNLDSAGAHEVKVAVTDGEYPIEKIWLINISDVGTKENITLPKITKINPQTNPEIVEGDTISLSINVTDLETMYNASIIWTNNLEDPMLYSRFEHLKGSFEALLDYNGSNYIKRFNITLEIKNETFNLSHSWILTVQYFDDADMDGYNDTIEIAWYSDPLDRSSTPLDTDNDFIVDFEDNDKDGDGILDIYDTYPLDPTRQFGEKTDYSVEILIIIITFLLVMVAIATIPQMIKR